LSEAAAERGWLTRARSEIVAKEASDRALTIVAAGCAAYSGETAALAAYLSASGQLTAGLALRALLCGQTGLFEATLAELTGLAPRRIAGLVKFPASAAFAAVYAEAGLPETLRPAFETALTVLAREDFPDDSPAGDGAGDGDLRLRIVQAVLRRCENEGDEAFGRLVALLRRFETEAAHEKGRRSLDRFKQQVIRDSSVQSPGIAPDIVIDLVALERELVAA
jgi:uncharacterized protein (DUF2336 family)